MFLLGNMLFLRARNAPILTLNGMSDKPKLINMFRLYIRALFTDYRHRF